MSEEFDPVMRFIGGEIATEQYLARVYKLVAEAADDDPGEDGEEYYLSELRSEKGGDRDEPAG